MIIVLYIPNSGKYISKDIEDGFTDDVATAQRFYSILSADCYACYLSHTYGLHVETRRYFGKTK